MPAGTPIVRQKCVPSGTFVTARRVWIATGSKRRGVGCYSCIAGAGEDDKVAVVKKVDLSSQYSYRKHWHKMELVELDTILEALGRSGTGCVSKLHIKQSELKGPSGLHWPVDRITGAVSQQESVVKAPHGTPLVT